MAMPISDVVDGDMLICTTRQSEQPRQPLMGPTMGCLLFPDIKVGETYKIVNHELMFRLLQRIPALGYLQLVERFHDCRPLYQKLQGDWSTLGCVKLRHRTSLSIWHHLH
jgi:hypothetical protein